MKHRLSHQHKLLQKMALTPQMRQSIQLLGMSTAEINEYIEQALSKNPFLKKEIRAVSKSSSSRGTLEEYDYIANIKDEPNPRLALIAQIKMTDLKGRLPEIAEYLIYEMDDNGYIDVETEAVAEDLSVSPEDVEKAISIIQGMEPAGIGARNITECLSLQLERMNKKNSLEYAIVNECINELAKNDIEKIAKMLDTEKKYVRAAVNNIKKLNPRPASNILSKHAQRIIPDLVCEVGNKKVSLMLNKDWMPQLQFYNPYEHVSSVAGDSEAKKFIKENADNAKTLIGNLKRREDTMLRVADYIIQFQKDNFLDEKGEIKSLTIKDVAQNLKMHTSTISRAISNKYVQINNEVMSINSLLSKGLARQNGEITSKTAIKSKINTIIKNENKSTPLTDDQIKEILEKEGIMIKRRTVAKYRDSLRILPVYLRKKIT